MLGRATITIAISLFAGGCNEAAAPRGRQFTLPLAIEGQPVGVALVDTGAEGELVLSDPHGLDIVGSVPIILFDGPSDAQLTEPFNYAVSGIERRTPGAIVRQSSCACDAIGVSFLRRSGLILALDYRSGLASVIDELPPGGIDVPLTPGLNRAVQFVNSSRVSIQLDDAQFVDAIFDTGANATALRRSVRARTAADGTLLRMTHYALGSVSIAADRVLPFDTEGLPDLIIGTDVMIEWGNVWYFEFTSEGGRAVVFRMPERAGPAPIERDADSEPLLQSSPAN